MTQKEKFKPTSEWLSPQDVLRRDSLMPLLASVVSTPISKPCPACIFKFHVSYCCIIDVLCHGTNLEIFLSYISLVKYCFFVHHRLIFYINILLQLVSFIYILLTNFNCYAEPRDSAVLTSSTLIRILARACVPRWSQMLPPKLYLVVFLSSEPGELDKYGLFGLQKTFGSASRKCLLYYITCSYHIGEL